MIEQEHESAARRLFTESGSPTGCHSLMGDASNTKHSSPQSKAIVQQRIISRHSREDGEDEDDDQTSKNEICCFVFSFLKLNFKKWQGPSSPDDVLLFFAFARHHLFFVIIIFFNTK
jgi:hypothetical protein